MKAVRVSIFEMQLDIRNRVWEGCYGTIGENPIVSTGVIQSVYDKVYGLLYRELYMPITRNAYNVWRRNNFL